MKKSLFILSSMIIFLTGSAFAETLFTEYDYVKKPLNITVYLYDIKSHRKDTTNRDCQFQIKDSYQVYTDKVKYNLGDTMHIKMDKVFFKQEHGINVIKGHGIWHGISPTDGKPFADSTYFYGTGLKDSGEIIGVLRDNYCQAKFKGEFTNKS